MMIISHGRERMKCLTRCQKMKYSEDMIETLRKELRYRIPMLVFLFYTFWWVIIQASGKSGTFYHDLFSDTYGISALIGAIIGYSIMIHWGGWKTKMGRAIMMFSLGLFLQAFGQFVYTYYFLVLGVDAPYPSIGDLGYFGSVPVYIYGVIMLAEASGINFSLRKIKNVIAAILLPLTILGLSYWIFLQDYKVDFNSPLVVLLDFAYPMGQAVYVALALLIYWLTRSILGGVMKDRILLILVALFVQYLADYMYLIQMTNDTWSAGGINDYVYLLSYFLMTLAILNMRVSEVRQKLVDK